MRRSQHEVIKRYSLMMNRAIDATPNRTVKVVMAGRFIALLEHYGYGNISAVEFRVYVMDLLGYPERAKRNARRARVRRFVWSIRRVLHLT